MEPLKSLNLSNAANGLINSGQNTKESSSMTFGISPEYEHNLWRPSLRRIFPDKRVKRSEIAIHLEHIYQARNRLAHHEPVLHGRFSDAINGIIYISEHLGAYPPSNQTPLAKRLAEDLAQTMKAANELHERLEAFKKSV